VAGARDCRKLVKKYSLPVDPAALTANCVLHAADHHGVVTFFSSEQFAMATRAPTLVDYLRCDVWITFWSGDDACWNPFEVEFLSRLRKPFYRELYRLLYAVDPGRAAHIVTSCSF
jgi:hypothetical protein